MTKIPKYEVYPDDKSEWRWRLIAGNGEIVSSGEGYKTRNGAVRGTEAHTRIANRARLVVLAKVEDRP